MSGQQRGQRQQTDAEASGTADQEAPTPQEVDTALQQEMRRQAAEREELPDSTDRVLDTGNVGGLGPQGSGHGHTSGKRG